MRLAVVSPFLDRQHGTELCVIEQLECFARNDHWNIDLYSQRVSQLNGLRNANEPSRKPDDRIVWRKVSEIPGPHLIKYVWWLFANHWCRWRDRSQRAGPDLLYSPGINCLDAQVITVHIVFHAYYHRIRSELKLFRNPIWSWPRLIHRRLYYKLLMFLEQKIYRNTRVRLIAVSRLVSSQLQSYFQRSDATVIHNGVDSSRFTAEARKAKKSSSRESFGFADSVFVLLLIGNDFKNKGLAALLGALNNLRSLPLAALVVGNDNLKAYDSLLVELGVPDRVHFEKPSSDVLSFYAAADLYVAPSLEDAFNLPILEAMACGLPVIASSQAGASEIIQDGQTGFILRDPRDDLELAKLIRRVFEDRHLGRTIGEAAAFFVRANCKWHQNASKTRQFLERALQDLKETSPPSGRPQPLAKAR